VTKFGMISPRKGITPTETIIIDETVDTISKPI